MATRISRRRAGSGTDRGAAGADPLLQPRRRPHQARSERRVRDILEVTALLLERAGLNSLTTNLIAAELDMSVATLYHYFPNKQAILHALGAKWLDEWQRAIDEIERSSRTRPRVEAFVEEAVERLLVVYRNQHGVLYLVQAMFTIPELRKLDLRLDEHAIGRLREIFRRLRVRGSAAELDRLARVYLKLCNALLPECVRQQGVAAARTLQDLKSLLLSLLSH
ncbi:MAG: TetR/AcrR family transcriptional regulator [Gammaproteobacteria bacterium]|nr:TetR/AcrR family transcriptional regulator [Gammaproteobacteria bacterium]